MSENNIQLKMAALVQIALNEKASSEFIADREHLQSFVAHILVALTSLSKKSRDKILDKVKTIQGQFSPAQNIALATEVREIKNEYKTAEKLQ